MHVITKALLIGCTVLFPFWQGHAQTKPTLTVEKIMQDPAQWIGTSPSNLYWSEDGKQVFFQWNPEKAKRDSLYSVNANSRKITKVSAAARKNLLPPGGTYNKDRTQRVYERNGDLFLVETKSGRRRQVTNTVERESSPSFTFDGQEVTYLKDGNLYAWSMGSGQTRQLTDFRRGRKPADQDQTKDRQELFLRKQQMELLEIVQKREEERKQQRQAQREILKNRPKEIYTEDKTVDNIILSPDERYITYRLVSRPANSKLAQVPNYVTSSGYTEEIPTRTKVGAVQPTYELGLYDLQADTTYMVSFKGLPGIQEKPAFLRGNQRSAGADTSRTSSEARKIMMFGPYYSPNGKKAVLVARSHDNKDRWIMSFDPATRTTKVVDRLHDDAWINGYGPGEVGWMPDNESIWFLSEESGYAHLYTVQVASGQKKALTSGKFEVQSIQQSKDKKYWYLTTNQVHPGEQHFYRMPLAGGKMEQITKMTGAHEVTMSPDEKTLAIRYSYSNKPWELYLMDNKVGAKPVQITQSTTAEFKAYPWREPEVITYKAADGAEVHARLYKPESSAGNGPAVIFVHGAGYLQNAHKWWSTYFREYMFHNLLVDKGYTVLDIDYRGSAGYGRDWRTGIYRHMGGKDLSDHVDGAKLLVEKYKVDPKSIGIYGGSYGGFITLMAMFTQPDVFAAGAALRSVTDWSHYNHGYTSNILNEPQADSLAYLRSSPIYFAEGLKGALLMCHGMVDTNVHFQDIVRLSQRLIELGKDNWELAVYPIEDHGFVEPSSWTDEYKRILKLFEANLNKSAPK
ncbi:prolyl oligopeptidase family serine peptidase [Rufibacter glacialis]|uniref:Prolyl oligopeptidase family serine peptidase n=1 Tax=Rufibacter glacialis TaxID=1259555 RepID=A0A5M8QPP4_9BACT|nr:prolyl oligopeptidase family serine peptidase [Rufibacter glacialis]KAA6437221.1 prolyl oligopeptidase family serine peptidase [Rufibacter glacialis]GGK61016.1 peptidase S9 [Rufibacter glacialis]